MIEKINLTDDLSVSIDSAAKLVRIEEIVNAGTKDVYHNRLILTFEQSNHLREVLNTYNRTIKI